MWYRVFGGSGDVEPAALLEHLQGLGQQVAGHFRADDQGWFSADLEPAGSGRLHLERYQGEEEGIRAELNTWAAWVEATGEGPAQERLMQRLVGSAQVFTLRPPEGTAPEAWQPLCLAVCRFLARKTAGVYQADGQGFFEADGTPLLAEP